MELNKVSKEAGLSMNPGKTKLITNGSTTPIFLNGQQVEYVQNYTYLGRNLTFHKCSEKET
jgi:hypothetical protein